jgi:hypothetical protein
VPRRHQIVVRFSDDELELIQERAAIAGLVLRAWVGQAVLEVASGVPSSVGLVDLLRLHADVLALERVTDRRGKEVAVMLALLDVAVDRLVAEVGRTRR